jgi:UDP-N-acetylglucosamine 2-epimerase
VDRFKVYQILKKLISQINTEGLENRLNILITPLYLYAINCIEGKTENRFSQLSFLQQFKVFPGKLKLKVGQCRLNKFKQTVFSGQNAILRQADILFYPVEPTHIKQMLPVSNLLKKSDYLYVTDRVIIYKTLLEKGIECILLNIDKYNHVESDLNENDINRELKLIAGKLFDEFESNEWITFAKNQINVRYPILYNFISELLHEISPKKVVVGYDITPEGRMLTVLCKDKNIPSICIQHGSIAGEPMDGEHIVDHYLLYGQKAKDYLVEIGNNPDSLEVFGAPYLDEISFSFDEREKFLKKLGLDIKKKTILIALSGPGHCTTFIHFDQIVSSIVKFAKSHPDFNYVFKLHRKDKKANYTKILKKWQVNIPAIEATDRNITSEIFAWLGSVDILITGSSTVALEAMLLKVPVLTIDYLNEYKGIDFIDDKCTYHVTDEGNLESIIFLIMREEQNNDQSITYSNAQNYINQYFYSDDTSASERISKWLMKL